MVGVNPVVIDANVVIRFLDALHPHHAAAVDLVEKLALEDVVIHPLTLAESLVGAIRAGDEAGALADIREVIGARDFVESQSPEQWARRVARLRAETSLRTPDAVVLDAARILGATVATYDLALAQAAQTEGRCYFQP